MEYIDPYPVLPERMPDNVTELHSWLRLAFEHGNADGATAAYENIAEQIAEVNPEAAHQLHRFAGTCHGRGRRAYVDLASPVWPKEAAE